MLGIVLYALILILLFLAGLHSLYTAHKNGIKAIAAAEEVLNNPSDSSIQNYLAAISNCELLNSGKLWDTMERSGRLALSAPEISEALKAEIRNVMAKKGIVAIQ